jgi:hypothetical protein
MVFRNATDNLQELQNASSNLNRRIHTHINTPSAAASRHINVVLFRWCSSEVDPGPTSAAAQSVLCESLLEQSSHNLSVTLGFFAFPVRPRQLLAPNPSACRCA